MAPRPASTNTEPKRPSLDDVAASMLVSDETKKPGSGSLSRAGSSPAKAAPPDAPATAPSEGDEPESRPGQPQTQGQGSAPNETAVDAASGDDTDDARSTTDGASDDEDGDTEKSPLDFTDDELFGDDTTDDTEDGPDADGEGEPLDTSKLTDDVKLFVTVDGEEREVTLGDLKKRYAGEGAIEKRLQEATEARKNAIKQVNDGRTLIETTLNAVGKQLLSRTVPQPDPALRASNPQEYLLQKDAYDEETRVLAQRATSIDQMMKQANQHADEVFNQAKQDAGARLREKLPILADPKRGPLVRAAISEAAEFLGFTQADLAQSADHRHFLALYHVAKLLRLQSKGRAKAKVNGEAPKGRSTLPLKGSRPNTVRASQARQQKEATAKARETGSVDDVAATMLQQLPRRSRRS